MRILVLSNIGSGLYKFRREVLAEMAKENEVFFCVPSDEYISLLTDMGCQFIDNPLLERHGVNPLKELKLLFFYRRVIKKVEPDIVFTYTIKPNVYGGMVCAGLGIPYVANITGLGTAVENGGALQALSLFLYRMGLRKARSVFFQNEENRDFMIGRGIVKGDYDVIPGSGVNLDQFRLHPYPDGDTVDFLFAGRIMKEKGIDQYIDAAKEIRDKHHETRFHICGSYEEDYHDTIRKLNDDGTVIYHGVVDDMVPFYTMASCVVLPTYYPEGLNNVLLEGAATGRPLITTNRPGCREVVDDGINGFFAERQNSRDLIEKVEAFLALSREEREKMGLAGRRKVEEHFDRRIIIGKYMDVIGSLNR